MWYFHSPKIAFGEESLAALEELDSQRAFIVTDKIVSGLGFVDKVLECLGRVGCESGVFDQVEPDPSLEIVRSCATEMTAFGPDLVIGLGGGSCMDAAKAAWFLYERPDVDLSAVNPFEYFGLHSKACFVTIPTTAGSGAEVTGGAVITDQVARRKMEVPTYELVPDLAIVDPEFTLKTPPWLTAESGIDALVHAIEGYTSSFANDFSDGLCLHAVRMIFAFLPRAYKNGENDIQARRKMANAATIAGLGVGASHIALAHALAHALGMIFHVSHSRGSGLFLPYAIEFNAHSESSRYLDLARLLDLEAADQAQAAGEVARVIRELMKSVDLPVSLKEAGIDADDFETHLEELCDRVETDSALATCTRFPYREDIRRLLMAAFDGRKVDF
jgi:alcohol dehydrogenase class IV